MVPAPVIELEPVSRRHEAALQRLASDPEVAATTPLPHPYPPDGAATFIARAAQARAQGSAYHFAIMAAGECCGLCGLKDVDPTRRAAEAGYWVGRPHWNRGYATAALRLLLAHAELDLGLRRVTANALEHNARSLRVLEKLGFSRVRRVLNAGRLADAPHDVYLILFERTLPPPR